jgi:hypothetical protein
MLDRLLAQLEGYRVRVYDDGSKPRLEVPEWCNLTRSHKNHGKQQYWKWVNVLLRKAKHDGGLVMVLPDDVTFADGSPQKAIELFAALEAQHRDRGVCLNLIRDSRSANWTGFKSVSYNRDILRTGWMDGCFVANQQFLSAFHRIPPQNPRRWISDPSMGSGVWEFVSRNNFAAGHMFFQVKKSLCVHGDHESVMHPDQRRSNPITSK